MFSIGRETMYNPHSLNSRIYGSMQPEVLYKILGDRRLVVGVTLLLMVVSGYQASLLVWSVIPAPAQGTTQIRVDRVASQSDTQAEQSVQQMVAEISRQNLFGKAEVAPPVQAVVKDAPKSTLNYKIRGIYHSADESLASIILEKASKTNFYRLGDEIDPRIFIHQIQPDHVIISRSGKLEKLLLEKPVMGAGGNVAARALPAQPSTPASAVLQSYKRRYANNPMALARRFKATPVSENGQTIGYKLKALRGEQLLTKLGLREDDVFTGVNGIGLDKPFQALDALKSLTTANDVSLTILRNGNEETVDFSLQ